MGIRDNVLAFPVLDELRVSELGRMRSLNLISHAEYEAGVRYGNVMLLYLASIDAPDPYGGDLGGLSEDICFTRKMRVAAAKTVLRDVAPQCGTIVDRVAVYNEVAGDESEIQLLRKGLLALCGADLSTDDGDKPADRESAWDRQVKILEIAEAETKERLRQRYK